MNIKKKNLLFIDNSRPVSNGSIGGSINSMIQLIARLDKNRYNIHMLLYYKFPIVENQLKSLEIITIYRIVNFLNP